VTLRVWEHERDEDALRALPIAADERSPPEAEVVSSRGDYLTVQIVSGTLTDPHAILFVETRGTFEIVRVEPWPGRTMLVLRGWPGRG
jgi:hypothetical protein